MIISKNFQIQTIWKIKTFLVQFHMNLYCTLQTLLERPQYDKNDCKKMSKTIKIIKILQTLSHHHFNCNQIVIQIVPILRRKWLNLQLQGLKNVLLRTNTEALKFVDKTIQMQFKCRCFDIVNREWWNPLREKVGPCLGLHLRFKTCPCNNLRLA